MVIVLESANERWLYCLQAVIGANQLLKRAGCIAWKRERCPIFSQRIHSADRAPITEIHRWQDQFPHNKGV